MNLQEKEIINKLINTNGWQQEGFDLKKEFSFKSFPAAVAFVVEVSFIAEKLNHHPEIVINYNKVLLSTHTHSSQGITE